MVQLTSTLSLCVLAATAFTTCYAGILPQSLKLHRRFTFVAQAPPKGWSTDSLEDYDQYHLRYLSLGCHKQPVGQDFFDSCCHPRHKTQPIESIPVRCQLDAPSLINANEYILHSTKNKGEIVDGVGAPVYVHNTSIQVLKPSEGRTADQPPTLAQVDAISKAETQVNASSAQLQSNSNTSTALHVASSVAQAPSLDVTYPSSSNTSAAGNTTAIPIVKAPQSIKVDIAENPHSGVNNATPRNSVMQSVKDAATAAAAIAKQAADDAAAKKVTEDAAANKASEDAAANKASEDAAAKKASEDAAAKEASDYAIAQKAKDEAASSSSQSSGSSSSSSIGSALAGVVSHVIGQDGGAKGTFFYQGGAAGACGTVNADSTPLVALPTALYNNGQHCGKQVMIKNTANGKTVVAKVQDECPGCPSDTSLDLSTGAFDAIGSQSSGVLPIEWGYM